MRLVNSCAPLPPTSCTNRNALGFTCFSLGSSGSGSKAGFSAECISDKNCMVSANQGGKVVGVAARLGDTAGVGLCLTICYNICFQTSQETVNRVGL
jgi:hypothetical protein